jgi:hypothetical protein
MHTKMDEMVAESGVLVGDVFQIGTNDNCNPYVNTRTFSTYHLYSNIFIHGVLQMIIIVLIGLVALALIVNSRHKKSNSEYEEYRAELVRVKAKRTNT